MWTTDAAQSRASSLERATAGVRTLAAYIWVIVYVIIVGPPGIVLAYVFGWKNALYQVAVFGVRVALAVVGIRYSVEGSEHILDRAAVYCVNHASNIEPPILFLTLRCLFPRLQILYKAELHKLPILSLGFDIVGFVPIERGNREQSGRAIDQAAAQVREGNSFLVFPEGTRSRTGELQRFKKGAFVLALKAQAPIVPMAIAGAREAMRKGSPIIWPVHVRVRLGRPVETAGKGFEDRDELVDSVRDRVHALLHAISA
jgi:1-acyl-sn-glycerol-3-phosphate acyltransferase